jgi:DNA-binding response OmpR family regulator
LKVRAVETVAALLAVVPCETTMVTRSPTCMALYLRRKVDDGFGRRLIHTIRGVGYELSSGNGTEQ